MQIDASFLVLDGRGALSKKRLSLGRVLTVGALNLGCLCKGVDYKSISELATTQLQCPPDTNLPYPQHCRPERSEGSAFVVGISDSAKLPQWRRYSHNAHPAPSSPTRSSVILNAVKDLRCAPSMGALLRVQVPSQAGHSE